MGECLQSNIFPLWNPYQNLGYPFHIDMQVPVWSPEALLFGYFTGHGLFSLQLLFVFYIFLAGAGMFLLIRYFIKASSVALIIASAYMLSGFFVSHVQHFHAVISGAYIPWVFLFFIKMLNKPSWQSALKTAVFFFLLISSGYQTFTIITSYCLFFIAIFYLFQHYKSKSLAIVSKTPGILLLFVFITLLLCLPLIISFFQVKPYIGRFSGLAYAKAIAQPFSPPSFLSLLSPFSAVKDLDFFQTDLSMENSYFGIIIIVLLLSSLFHRKSAVQKLLFVSGILFLLLAMGDYLPVFKLSRYFPLLGMFRFPGYYRFYATFVFFILAAFHLREVIRQPEKYKKSLLISTGFITLILIGLLYWSISKTDFNTFSYLNTSLPFSEWICGGTLYENTFLYSVFQLIILGVFSLIILKSRKLASHLLLLITMEMLISVQVNIYQTAISGDSAKDLACKLDKLPKGFPKPNLSLKVKDVVDDNSEIKELSENTNMILKKVSADAFTSFHLKGFDNIREQRPNLFKAVINNPFIYLSDEVFPLDALNDSIINPDKHHLHIYLDKKSYNTVSVTDLDLSHKDTLFVSSFSPNEIIVQSQTKHPTLINLLQSDYPDWEIFIDNKAVQKLTVNTNFISALLPPGIHQVSFVYENNLVLYAAYFSYGLLLVIILLIACHHGEELSKKNKILILLALSILFIVVSTKILTNKPYIKTEKEYLAKMQKQSQMLIDSLKGRNITVLFNTDANDPFKNIEKSNFIDRAVMRFEENSDINSLHTLLQSATGDYFIYGWLNLRNPDEVEEIIRLKYPRKIAINTSDRSSLTLFVKDTNYTRPSIFYSLHDFESYYKNWSDEINTDTVSINPLSRCNTLDSVMGVSAIYSITIDHVEKFKEKFISIGVDVLAKEGVDASIIFSIHNEKGTFVYEDLRLEADSFNWVKNLRLVNTGKKISQGDMIRIYVWNRSKTKVCIDNFSVAAYAE